MPSLDSSHNISVGLCRLFFSLLKKLLTHFERRFLVIVTEFQLDRERMSKFRQSPPVEVRSYASKSFTVRGKGRYSLRILAN